MQQQQSSQPRASECPLDQIIAPAEAAEVLGVTPTQVRLAIRQGRLRAKLLGREYAIWRPDVLSYTRPARGRPKKQS